MATKYRVVIRGLKPGESANLVAIRLGTLFKLPPEKVVPVLSRPGTPIKAGIDLERAVKYQTAFENAGCDCIVEPDVASTQKTPAAGTEDQARPSGKGPPKPTADRPPSSTRTGSVRPAAPRSGEPKRQAGEAASGDDRRQNLSALTSQGRATAVAIARSLRPRISDLIQRLQAAPRIKNVGARESYKKLALAVVGALGIIGATLLAINLWHSTSGEARLEAGIPGSLGLTWSKRIERFILTLKPGVYRCDVLAASPRDAARLAEPVEADAVDVPAAITACRSAVAKAPENARLHYQLGRALDYGRQKGEAFEAYKRAAELGNVSAQHKLGVMYLAGEGTAQSAATGFAWIIRVVAQNYPYGYLTLGLAYQRGTHVPRNDKLAANYLHRAAEAGLPEAEAKLASIYFNGSGVVANDAEGFAWAAKAANQGEPYGYFLVGFAFMHGRGVAKDPAQAKDWLERAAVQRHHGAEYLLGVQWLNGDGVPKNPAVAAQWLRKAADGGWVNAQTKLADLYEKGEGVPKDDRKAVEWNSKAAATGNAYALYSLGWAHEHGKGVPGDMPKARSYYAQAAKAGSKPAQERLANLERPRSATASVPRSSRPTDRRSRLCDVNPAACEAMRRNNDIRQQVQSQRCQFLQGALAGTGVYESQMRKAGCL